MTNKLQFMILGIVLCLTGALHAETVTPSPDQTCLAQVIYHESGNQPLIGQYAVGEVIINRVKIGFATTPCSVVRQRSGKHWQFGSFVFNKNLIPKSRRQYFYNVAQQVLNNNTNIFLPPNVLYFNNTLFDKRMYTVYAKIGHQYFFTKIRRG